MIEIERTFLVKNIPNDLGKYKSAKIMQGYIVSGDSVIRVRSKGDHFELTKKWKIDPNDHRRQNEVTIELTKDEFEKIWTLVDKFVEKIRYLIPLNDDLTAELDVFQGKMMGHAVVEVEFKDENQMNLFQAPVWFGVDISQDDIGSSGFLAGKSFEEIKGLLPG